MADIALILTDYGKIDCGVGHATSAWVTTAGIEPVVIDPRLGIRSAWRPLARKTLPLAVVYPTRSGRGSVRTIMLLISLRLAKRRVSAHIHEFRRLRWLHRTYVRLLIGCCTGVVVVSTRSEAKYVASRTGRHAAVCPTPSGGVNLLAVRQSEPRSVDRQPTIGVFGMPRRDKALDTLWAILEAQSAIHGSRIEFVGSGWTAQLIPERVGRLFDVRVFGAVEDGRIAMVLGKWSAAVAPASDGATDGRSSVRVPCCYGVPVVTMMPHVFEDLTFRPNGLFDIRTASLQAAGACVESARAELVRYTHSFEFDCRMRLAAILSSATNDGMRSRE